MGRASKYPDELRERAVRMVAEVRPQYPSQWAAITAVAGMLGIGAAETLRTWIRRAEIDTGVRPGVTSQMAEENKALRREIAELQHNQSPDSPGRLKENLYREAKDLFTARDVLDLFKDNAALVQALNKSLEATDAAARSAALRSTVKTWFDREMDQLSAMYRRQVRRILAILAFFIVLIFPANTLGIVSDLRSDTALRQAVTNQAIASVEPGTLNAITAKYCPPSQDAVGNPLEEVSSRFECAGKLIESANAIALVPDFDQIQRFDGQQGFSTANVWHYESERWGIPGRAITILALMFGAQFWFDVLRRLVGIRKSIGGDIGSGAG